jgi:hypothetical protein
MSHNKSWKASLAILLTLGLGTVPAVPFFATQSATAQVFSANRTFRIVRGTVIPTAYDDGETTKIVVTPDETLKLTLTTTLPVQSTLGTVIIPAGSRIMGQIEPYEDGVRFVAERLELDDGTRQEINATSEVISQRQKVSRRGGNDDAVWQGALVGGAASTVISAVVTDVGIFKTLAGAGAGALTGWLISKDRKKEVIVIDPERDLNLAVNEEFLLSRRVASRLSIPNR